MKLTQSLLVLLQCTLCHAISGQEQSTEKQPPQHHGIDYKAEYLKAKELIDLLLSDPKLQVHNKPARHAQADADADGDADSTIQLETEILHFLPPPWSPTSNVDSPYPPSGVTPYDDSGRSEVLDNEPSVQELWRTCPDENLDCSKCPRDTRCRRPGQPWWTVGVEIDPSPAGADISTSPDVAASADISPSLSSDGSTSASSTDLPIVTALDEHIPGTCPLTTCELNSPFTSCGKNATCVRTHCVCETGYKAGPNLGPIVRGFEGLQAVTVWVDPGVACAVPCDTLDCAEVEQVKACFDGSSIASPIHGSLMGSPVRHPGSIVVTPPGSVVLSPASNASNATVSWNATVSGNVTLSWNGNVGANATLPVPSGSNEGDGHTSESEEPPSSEGVDDVETASTGGGAIRVPGADVDGLDNMDGEV